MSFYNVRFLRYARLPCITGRQSVLFGNQQNEIAKELHRIILEGLGVSIGGQQGNEVGAFVIGFSLFPEPGEIINTFHQLLLALTKRDYSFNPRWPGCHCAKSTCAAFLGQSAFRTSLRSWNAATHVIPGWAIFDLLPCVAWLGGIIGGVWRFVAQIVEPI